MALARIALMNEVPVGQARQVTVNGKSLAVFNVAGKIYAIDNECPHRNGPLAEGVVTGTEVECPWHGARFDLVTGGHLSPPASQGVKSYPVQVVGDEIQVDI